MSHDLPCDVSCVNCPNKCKQIIHMNEYIENTCHSIALNMDKVACDEQLDNLEM